MKITTVNIPKSFRDNGINEIKMDRLGKIVLIAGKNGSGKTRILHKIKEALNEKPSKAQVLNFEEEIESVMEEIKAKSRELSFTNNQFTLASSNVKEHLKKDIGQLKKEIQMLINEKENLESNIWRMIETDELSDNYDLVSFVPKSLDLTDCYNFGKSDFRSAANSVNKPGINNLSEGCLAKIQFVQDLWFNATHPNFHTGEINQEEAINSYKKLENLVRLFLRTEIKRNNDGYATLFGFPLPEANLSEGQKILLQFCVAIHSQETELDNIILCMEEPENHLHPSIMIETIDRISETVTNGQIWIATHSVPLLAHFDSNDIWYMEEGTISYAGNIPENVLKSLIGDETQVEKLNDFIGLPSQLALNRFAFECLFEPGVVFTEKDDPQIRQIRANFK